MIMSAIEWLRELKFWETMESGSCLCDSWRWTFISTSRRYSPKRAFSCREVSPKHAASFEADTVNKRSRWAREIGIDMEGIVVADDSCWLINVGKCMAFSMAAGCYSRCSTVGGNFVRTGCLCYFDGVCMPLWVEMGRCEWFYHRLWEGWNCCISCAWLADAITSNCWCQQNPLLLIAIESNSYADSFKVQ